MTMKSGSVEMVLVGTYAGRTIELGGHRFVDGACRIYGAPDALQCQINVLKRNYSAIPSNSRYFKEFDAYGKRKVPPGEEPNSPAQVRADVQRDGQGTPAPASVPGGQDAMPDAGATGLGAEGDGHEDPRVSVEPQPEGQVDQRLSALVSKLDPDDDAHWTESGLPALAALQTGDGQAGITRADVEAALPGWNRDSARTTALENLA